MCIRDRLISVLATSDVARYRHVASGIHIAAVPTTALKTLGREGQPLRRYAVIGLDVYKRQALALGDLLVGQNGLAGGAPVDRVLLAIDPVSYTHLDVYKRQSL